MNKKLIAIGITLVFLIVGLSGCIEENKKETEDNINAEENINGEWYAYQNETVYSFTFYNDGTCKYSFGLYIMGKYYIVGDKLEFHHEVESHTPAFQNYYKLEMPDKDTLILTTTRDDFLAHDGRLEFSRLN